LCPRSFNIAKSTDRSEYFIKAADIAHQADSLFNGESPLEGREPQCLMAAIASNMKKFDMLNVKELREMIDVIARYEQCGKDIERDDSEYLVCDRDIFRMSNICVPNAGEKHACYKTQVT
jgi:hypothetical protein